MSDKFIFNFKGKRSRELDNADKALGSLEAYLESGTPFELAIPKSAQEFIKQIEKLIDELGVNVEMDTNSNPEAIDYLINFVLGSSWGAFQGAAFGTSLWLAIAGALTAAAKVGAVTAPVFPPVAPFVVVGAVTGGIGGAALGLSATRWRLKVSFKSSLIVFDKEAFIFFSFEPQT